MNAEEMITIDSDEDDDDIVVEGMVPKNHNNVVHVLSSDSDSEIDLVEDRRDVVFESHSVKKSVDKTLDIILEGRQRIRERTTKKQQQMGTNGSGDPSSSVKYEKVSPFKTSSIGTSLPFAIKTSPFKVASPMKTIEDMNALPIDTTELVEKTASVQLTATTTPTKHMSAPIQTPQPIQTQSIESRAPTENSTPIKAPIVTNVTNETTTPTAGRLAVEKSVSIESEIPAIVVEKDERFVCSYDPCNQVFRSALLFYKHEKKHSNALRVNNEKPFKCIHNDCFFSASTQTELMYHNSEHFNIFMCRDPNCVYKASNAFTLNAHMKRHPKGNSTKKLLNKKSKIFCDCGEDSCVRR